MIEIKKQNYLEAEKQLSELKIIAEKLGAEVDKLNDEIDDICDNNDLNKFTIAESPEYYEGNELAKEVALKLEMLKAAKTESKKAREEFLEAAEDFREMENPFFEETLEEFHMDFEEALKKSQKNF